MQPLFAGGVPAHIFCRHFVILIGASSAGMLPRDWFVSRGCKILTVASYKGCCNILATSQLGVKA